MKLHWSPSHLPDWVLVVVAALSLAGFYAVEHSKRRVRVKDYDLKLQAARLTEEAFKEIRSFRKELNLPIDTIYDPLASGLIGHQYSPITTRRGELNEKILTTNPNIAAIIVELFKKAGVKPGDTVGIGWNGSYPGLNIAILAVCRAMHVKPIVITSNESSMWGANDSLMTWLDMERRLQKAGIFDRVTLWATLGGEDDNGLGITPHGIQLLVESIQRNGIELRKFGYLDDDVMSRIDSYGRIKAYINVGYNPASYAPPGERIPAGTFRHPIWRGEKRSVLQHYMAEGKPVINLVDIGKLVSRFVDPHRFIEQPQPGKNDIFFEKRYSLWVTGLVVLLIGVIVFGLIRFDLTGYLVSGHK